mgnify:CR=1 FL=1
MFAKETYTTHRNSLKKRGDSFLLFGTTRRVARIILIISAKVLLLFIFRTCPMPDWRYGYHIVWMGSSLPCVRKRRGWE